MIHIGHELYVELVIIGFSDFGTKRYFYYRLPAHNAFSSWVEYFILSNQ
jgi:hypothetical protein